MGDCVTLVPEKDKRRGSCPYIIRNHNVVIHEMDVEDFSCSKQYDLLHDDVDIVGWKDLIDGTKLAKAMLQRFRKHHGNVRQCLGTLYDITPDVVDLLYDTYSLYGHFDLVKPLYSNPWKPEIMVYFRKSNNERMKKNTFLRTVYGFLNRMAVSMIRWSVALNSNISRVLDGQDIEECVHQHDSTYVKFCESKLIM